MAITIDYSARFQAGTMLKKSGTYGNTIDRIGIVSGHGRTIIGFPITKDANEIVTSITFNITKKLVNATTSHENNYSWFIGMLDEKMETTDTVAIGDQLIAAMESATEKQSFRGISTSTTTTTNTVTIDNIYWSEGTTKYVYIYNTYYNVKTYAWLELTNVTIDSYLTTDKSSPEVMRMPINGFKGGSDANWCNDSLYIGYGLSSGSPQYYEGIFQFYTPFVEKTRVDYYNFSFNYSNLPNYSGNPLPKTMRWAITTTDADLSLYNNKVGAVTDDPYQVATGTCSVTAVGNNDAIITGVQLEPSTLYNIIVWGEGTASSGNAKYTGYGTIGYLAEHYFNAYYKSEFYISYDANGHGTAPAQQTKQPGVDLTLHPFISDQVSTGYKVTFSANGGNNTPTALTSLLSHSQNYWNTNSSGTSTNYASEDTYSNDESATLYAIWSTTNGAINLPSAITKNDEPTTGYMVKLQDKETLYSTLDASRVIKYNFNNWTDSNSGTTYNPGETYVPNQNTVMYATWNSNILTNSVTLPSLTKEDYRFKGWSSDPSAEEGIVGEYTPNGNITLYAIWKPTKITFVKVNGLWKTK